MANTLTNVIPQLLAQGLMALRQNAVMARLVNSDYGTEAASKGQTITIPIPSAVTASAVTASQISPAAVNVVPTKADITMDQWYEAPFAMTDKDNMDCMNGILPMQASEAIKSLINVADAYILGKYPGIYGYVGTAGTTPFASDSSDVTAARKVLNNQLAPMDDRRFTINADAEANALGLRAFQDMSFSGSATEITEGKINRKFGFDWHMDQNIPTHTAGTAVGATTDATGYAVGLKGVTLASAGTGSILTGDIITFAGDTQTYVIVTGDASVAGGGTLTFEPGLKVIIAAAATAITVKASHAVNLAFHRDAFAFVSRPLADNTQGLGNIIQSATDPISGISLRLEVSREYKQTRYSFDILFGAALVRADLACRVAG